jgi:zinc transporter ZupT
MYSGESQHAYVIGHSNHHHRDTFNNHADSHRGLILPFTIGGFLYIALVGIIPEIVQEQDPRISIKQMFFFFIGVLFIFVLCKIEHILPFLVGV